MQVVFFEAEFASDCTDIRIYSVRFARSCAHPFGLPWVRVGFDWGLLWIGFALGLGCFGCVWSEFCWGSVCIGAGLGLVGFGFVLGLLWAETDFHSGLPWS